MELTSFPGHGKHRQSVTHVYAITLLLSISALVIGVRISTASDVRFHIVFSSILWAAHSALTIFLVKKTQNTLLVGFAIGTSFCMGLSAFQAMASAVYAAAHTLLSDNGPLYLSAALCCVIWVVHVFQVGLLIKWRDSLLDEPLEMESSEEFSRLLERRRLRLYEEHGQKV